MNYLSEFKKFWNQEMKYVQIKNKERIYDTFCKLYKSVKTKYDIADIIDKYIVDNKAHIMQKVQIMFCKYLKIDTDLKNKNLKLSNIERELCILRDSQGEFKISELNELYDILDVRPDIEMIEEGFSFLGTEIKPKVKKISGARYIYEDTVHPLFLALNLTEVHTLLKLLPDFLLSLECNDDEKRMIKLVNGLIERMQLQLSDYALEKIGLAQKDMSNKVLKFISEKDMIKQKEGKLMYLYKRMTKNQKIVLNGIDEYTGSIKEESGNFFFYTDDEKKIEIDDLDTISFVD